MSDKKDNFEEMFTQFADNAAKTIQDSSTRFLKRVEIEKKKAELRAEIGHHTRDLRKIYENLGRQFYASRTADKPVEDLEQTFQLVHSKEKVIELLNEKLADLDKE